MHSRFTLAPVVVAALLAYATVAPRSLRAQQPTTTTTSSASAVSEQSALPPTPAPAAGPRLVRSGIDHADASAALGTPAQPNNVGVGPNLALMLVGAAAVITGLVVGGNGGGAIAVVGGVVGLVGLYRFLR